MGELAWRAWRDSNPRHSVPKTDALSTELRAHTRQLPEGVLMDYDTTLPNFWLLHDYTIRIGLIALI